MNDIEMLLQRIESNLNRPLEDFEVSEITLWHRGKSLAQIVGTEGWTIALDTLKSYPDSSVEKLMNIDPKYKEDAVAEHAVAFAASRIYKDFTRAISDAVNAASTTPDVVLQALRATPSPAPDVL